MGVTEWKPVCTRTAALNDAPISVTAPGLTPAVGLVLDVKRHGSRRTLAFRGHLLRGHFPPSELLRLSTVRVCVRVWSVRLCVVCAGTCAHVCVFDVPSCVATR